VARLDNSHCEVFFTFWRKNTANDSPLSFCLDVVWVELNCGRGADELKQRYGLYSWVVWWALTSLKCCNRLTEFPPSADLHSPVFGILDTPAHLNTLEPLIAETRRAHQVGIICPSGSITPTINFDLPVNAPSFLVACRLLALTFKGVRLASDYLKASALKCDFRLKGRLASRIYRSLVGISWGKTLTPATGPLFVTYELLPWQKALVGHWRKSSSRVVHIMHGQRQEFYRHTHATDLVLFSNLDEPWFRAKVDPSVKIWTIGHPRLEAVRQQVGLPHSFEGRLPRITFFSQPAEFDYSRSLRIADWLICSALRGKAEVRFRAHPREDRVMLATDMKAAGIDFMQVSEAGLIEDLKWCDAVASSWSTVSMEAAACGRGIFWTCSTPEKYEVSQELRDHHIGVLIQNAPDWAPYLKQWADGGWKSPVTVSDEQLRELGMIGDTSKSWMERLEIKLEPANRRAV
jgi:hypothetical protein